MPVSVFAPAEPGPNRLSDADLAAWQAVPVSVVADLEPRQQIDPSISLKTRASDTRILLGRALTVACTPPDFGAVVHTLDHAGPGDVVVIAAQGQTDTAVIGEILGGHLRAKGCAGLVVDGAVRDIDALGGWADFPVYARAINPRGPTSANDGALFAPVEVGGCVVSPGDLILGDADGLVALPAPLARNRLQAAQDKLALEAQWIDGLATGKPASEVFGL